MGKNTKKRNAQRNWLIVTILISIILLWNNITLSMRFADIQRVYASGIYGGLSSMHGRLLAAESARAHSSDPTTQQAEMILHNIEQISESLIPLINGLSTHNMHQRGTYGSQAISSMQVLISDIQLAIDSDEVSLYQLEDIFLHLRESIGEAIRRLSIGLELVFKDDLNLEFNPRRNLGAWEVFNEMIEAFRGTSRYILNIMRDIPGSP